MRNWIEIDGKRSTEFGLRMARLPLWPVAAETVENIPVSGVAVESDRHTGQYPDFELPLTGYLTRPQSPIELAKLNDWLMNGKELILSTQPELRGIIRKVGRIEPVRIGTRANEIRIPFTMQPFKYAAVNLPKTYTTHNFTVFNRGNICCEPKFILTFSDFTLIAFLDVNGERLQIQPFATGSNQVVVDVQRKKVYTVGSGGTLTVVQQYTSGRFWAQVLRPGWNDIAVTSECESVEVTLNERWL